MWEQYWQDRGSPWEYDPGPAKNRSWSRLFAETPNYRGFGVAMSGNEEFRWHFGPMFYRGRLGDNQVKVLIVGQEGAQDESLSHRSFTGGTGGRMQHLLTHLGINRSYLFLNTFVYPIFGQYDGLLPIIAQHPASPIAQHRRKLFDYVAERNNLQLVVAVGRAAKESVASWVEAHGGNADPNNLHLADASVIDPDLHLVGVLHPGGAGQGGAVSAIIASFNAAINHVHQWIAAEPSWLPVDAGGIRATTPYTYSSDPIPFRDFPYGVPWRMGRQATSSNRRDGQTSIQIFSEDGAYNNDGTTLTYPGSTAGTNVGYGADVGDVAWEPPRRGHKDFDRGPGATFAALLQGGKPGFPWPDFETFGLKCSPSFGTGPIYRGRLDRPSILVLADQQSHDDLFTMRALTGDDGQRLQSFLRAGRSHGPVRHLAHASRRHDVRQPDCCRGGNRQRAGPGALCRSGPGIAAAGAAAGRATREATAESHQPDRATGGDDEVAVAVRCRCQLAGRAGAVAGADLPTRHHDAGLHLRR